MKKQKIEKLKDRRSTQLWSNLPWVEVCDEVNLYIREQSRSGYANPMIETEVSYDDVTYVVAVYREETDEEFAIRKSNIERKELETRAKKIEKLKKEAKELGLEVKE